MGFIQNIPAPDAVANMPAARQAGRMTNPLQALQKRKPMPFSSHEIRIKDN